jgi:hypothetical protein
MSVLDSVIELRCRGGAADPSSDFPFHSKRDRKIVDLLRTLSGNFPALALEILAELEVTKSRNLKGQRIVKDDEDPFFPAGSTDFVVNSQCYAPLDRLFGLSRGEISFKWDQYLHWSRFFPRQIESLQKRVSRSRWGPAMKEHLRDLLNQLDHYFFTKVEMEFFTMPYSFVCHREFLHILMDVAIGTGGVEVFSLDISKVGSVL